MNRNITIERELYTARQVVEAVMRDEAIQAVLAEYGYDTAMISTGQQLYQQAEASVQDWYADYGEQYAATAEVQALWAEAKEVFRVTRQIARLAFEDDNYALTALRLRGPLDHSFSGWLNQVTTFYQNIFKVQDWLATMAAYGYDQARLEAQAAKVDTVLEAHIIQQEKMLEAQQATQARDKEVGELNRWMRQFKGVVRAIFAEETAVLAKLGLS